MRIINYEFKARIDSIEPYEHKLVALNPRYNGIHRQTDTYFDVPKGRLKLREGSQSNDLIQYDRPDMGADKLSQVILYQHDPNPALKEILTAQFGVLTIVHKIRKIYFTDDAKCHLDEVEGLGFFIEVEVFDYHASSFSVELRQRCADYRHYFGIEEDQLISQSYSDLILAKV